MKRTVTGVPIHRADWRFTLPGLIWAGTGLIMRGGSGDESLARARDPRWCLRSRWGCGGQRKGPVREQSAAGGRTTKENGLPRRGGKPAGLLPRRSIKHPRFQGTGSGARSVRDPSDRCVAIGFQYLRPSHSRQVEELRWVMTAWWAS